MCSWVIFNVTVLLGCVVLCICGQISSQSQERGRSAGDLTGEVNEMTQGNESTLMNDGLRQCPSKGTKNCVCGVCVCVCVCVVFSVKDAE